MIYDIVISGPVGNAGAKKLAEDNMEILLARYSRRYIEKALKRDISRKDISGLKNAGTVCELGEGGINAALWEMSVQQRCGLRVMLYDIPLDQDIVEICNTLDTDPYTLDSAGQYLCLTESGLSLVEELKAAGYPEAALIGHTSSDNKKLIIYGDVERFLTPPERG